MTDTILPKADTDGRPDESVRSRRAVIAAGATTLAGAAAVGVAASTPANAAAGDAVILGRSNSSGSVGTGISSTATGVTVAVHNAGTGAAALMTSARSNGFAGGSHSKDAYGVSAANYAADTGFGAAIAAGGGANDGIIASTTSPERSGVVGMNLGSTVGPEAAVSGYGENIAALVAVSDATQDTAAFVANTTGGDGLVVIGNTVCTSDLQVYGDVQVNGDLYVHGTIYTDNAIAPIPTSMKATSQSSRVDSLKARAKAFVSRVRS